MGQDYHSGSCGRSGTVSISRRDASSSPYGGPSTISEAARKRSDKVQYQAPLLRKIIWKREQQRKTEVEIEDISYSSSTRQFRGSIFGEPIEEGTEFNEDIFPQQTVAT